MNEVIVYGPRISPFVEKVVRAIAYKGIPFRLSKFGTEDWKISSKYVGKVPIVSIGGSWVYDSTFIIRELEKINIGNPLFSRDPKTSALQRLLEDWSDESLYWYVFSIRWSQINKKATRNELAALVPNVPGFLSKNLAEMHLLKQTKAQGTGRLPYETLITEMSKKLDDLVTLLDGKPYFYSHEPSAADFAIYGQLKTAISPATPDMQAIIKSKPELSEFMARVEAVTESCNA